MQHKTTALCVLFLFGAVFAQEAAPVVAPTAGAGPYAPYKLELEHWRRPALDQGGTGTCWSFATTSFFESEFKRINKQDVDLSEMWFMRAAAIEKARRHLSTKGRTRFDQGGLCHDVVFIVERHGAQSAAAFPGLAGEAKRHNHAKLWADMHKVVDAWLKEGVELTPLREKELVAILDTHLGSAKADAADRKSYTEKLKLPFADYVEVMSTTSMPVGARGNLKVPDNWMECTDYLNMDLDAMVDSMDRALRAGYTVALDIDVSEKGFGPGGVAKLSDEEEKIGAITPKMREDMFQDGRTTDDHLMHVVGLLRDTDGKRWYLVKDSGGEKRWRWKGNMAISENYMRAKALGYMVHKAALTLP
ncbi:MAG: hypothetical protein EXS14_10535 [Planctomycetes bacterium]|nr:hypothetical protein [Planctomycetota bacterium]